jgi:hypothetical protein
MSFRAKGVARGEAVCGEEAERLEAQLHSSTTKGGTADSQSAEAARDGKVHGNVNRDPESVKDDDGELVSQRA